jgi:hypothetical protein
MLSATGRRRPKQFLRTSGMLTDFVVLESSGFDDHEKF